MPVVEAVMLAVANVQYPATRPFTVVASGSSPTFIAEVLAVPTSTTLVAPRVMVPLVLLDIVSSFWSVRSALSVRAPVEENVEVAVPPKYAVSWTENRVEEA